MIYSGSWSVYFLCFQVGLYISLLSISFLFFFRQHKKRKIPLLFSFFFLFILSIRFSHIEIARRYLSTAYTIYQAISPTYT
ncbi:hypothetical protein QBC37DRAFT_418344 [Rhypophila decipiens]|uniref:Uncharacterized protein n=1 Tax=Rhypophila decipiens TaxID=261697 RepID=A0AAN6YDH5_9PEZI|nr:hypothetical protein QBC37DRAFT_418344 [Rhypophila decipiens]